MARTKQIPRQNMFPRMILSNDERKELEEKHFEEVLANHIVEDELDNALAHHKIVPIDEVDDMALLEATLAAERQERRRQARVRRAQYLRQRYLDRRAAAQHRRWLEMNRLMRIQQYERRQINGQPMNRRNEEDAIRSQYSNVFPPKTWERRRRRQ